MRKFNRLHCTSTVRARFTDSWGRVITLTGTHAFEYTIHIEGIRTVTETFVNGTLARKRFNELKRKPREKDSKLRELHPRTIMNCLEEYILSI